MITPPTKYPNGDSQMPASPSIVQAYEWLSYCSNKGRSHYRRHFVGSPPAILHISTSHLPGLFQTGGRLLDVLYELVFVCGRGWGGWRGAGRVAYSKSMPQIVVRCRSPSAMRFGQEGNVIGFVQSSWQPAPADICSLLTTQTYLHQGTHTHACMNTGKHTLSRSTDTCTRRFARPRTQPRVHSWGWRERHTYSDMHTHIHASGLILW